VRDLYTIGYQQRSLDSFLETLACNEIDVLMDVRHTPWSRKPDFSRTRLSRALAEREIAYLHRPELGSAPALRRELHETHDWERFSVAYLEHLDSLNGALESTFSTYDGKRVCLLCMEADHIHCHRSLLAERLVELGAASEPIHL